MVETMQIKIDGIPVLIRWAHLCGELSSDNGRVISEDILRMLHMPEIMVALTFERDMGLYFAVTSRWHGSPGSLGERPGFRSMELHTLWFEFVCPWWTNTMTSSETRNFRSTFAAINTISDESIQQMKKEQVVAGINAGYKQIVKLSEILLSVPVIFAAITDWKRGPALARAIVCIVKEKKDLS